MRPEIGRPHEAARESPLWRGVVLRDRYPTQPAARRYQALVRRPSRPAGGRAGDRCAGRRGRALRARRRGCNHHHHHRPQPDEGAASEPNDPTVGSAVWPHRSHGPPPARRTGRLTTHNKLEACHGATRDLADRTVPGDRADRVRRSIRRPATETKAAVKTTGFYAFLVVLVGILNCRQQHRGRGRRSRLLRRRQGVAIRHAADCRLHGQPRSGQGREPRPLLLGARRPRHRPLVTHGLSSRGRAPDGNESPPGPRPTLRTGQRAGRKHRLATSGRWHFLAWP